MEDIIDETSGDGYPTLSFGGEFDSTDWTPKIGTNNRYWPNHNFADPNKLFKVLTLKRKMSNFVQNKLKQHNRLCFEDYFLSGGQQTFCKVK